MRRFITGLCLLTIFAASLLSAAEYDKILADMNAIINGDASYAQMFDIGVNDQNNTIYGLRIENPSYQVEEGAKSNLLLVGAHHGNERASAWVSITFAKNLLTILKDPSNPQYAALSRHVFYIIPVLNIGGFNANRRYETNRQGSSVDPNRDYTDICVGGQYFRLASTTNLSNFVSTYQIVGGVTGHGYVGTFTYPWGIYTSNTKTLDNSTFSNMAQKAVQANGYRTGTHTDVIYAASGAFEDWAYAQFGIWMMLLEISSSSADLSKDAQCLLNYFALVPSQRSQQHQHTGTCTQTRGEFDSRP